MRLALNTIKKRELIAERAVTWGLPLAIIPSLRYVEDHDKPAKIRKELFVRDFTSYAVGLGIYLATLIPLTKIVKTAAISDFKKHMIPVTAAATAFCVWSGMIAPKLSKIMTKNRKLDFTI